MAEFHTRAYRGGMLAAEQFPMAEVSDYLEQADTMVWVDFLDPSKEQLDQLAGELDLHELAVEDALGPHQRPKLDRYSTHLFLACHAVSIEPASRRLHTTEIDAFVGTRWIVTVRKDERFPFETVVARWERSADLTALGVSFLLYGLLDVVVDGFFEVIDVLEQYYDEVSDGIFAESPLDPTQQRQWFQARQALVAFHRLVAPMREAVSALMRHEHAAVPEELYPYYEDVYDHILRVSESAEALRELVGTIVETNLSLRDYRQNQIVKKVSSWAAIIAVPALITGYYGMNLPYPGAGQVWGVYAATAVMVAISAALYATFRARDWL